MATFKKITFYNLSHELRAPNIAPLIGRADEMERIDRVIGRRINNNILLVGEDGLGKSTLVYGWVRKVGASQEPAVNVVQLDAEHLSLLDMENAPEEKYTEAFASMRNCVVFIDDFGREVYKNFPLMQRAFRVYKRALQEKSVSLILTVQKHEYAWIERECPAFVQAFETMQLKNQTVREQVRILGRALPRLNKVHRVIVPDSTLTEVAAYAERFPSLGQTPQSAITLLDEALSFGAAKQHKVLTQDAIAAVVEAKTGVPKARLKQDELQKTKELERELNLRIVDQKGATGKIATTLQRARLGLRNPARPLGSFLLLGPSGVGKTETAKCVADLMFGSSGSFLRFDMSEFQQEHMVQRLIGAPAGYVGHEAGGALTNALKKDPYSLILLDEIEKAHPKVFDIFLQVLDDGRLTSGENETVDARNAIIMATSNAAVHEILQACASGTNLDEESFVREVVLPVLAKTFRLEFINRFDSILLFRPLSVPALMQVAHLEIKKVERRLEKHHVRFALEPKKIEEKIRSLADPRFGARPVKRFIEETCETLLMRSLLANPPAAV